ncbi:unnamed protein product [Lasius platythorax]|uniref:Uncharacterized protein n=1 Tax=Lasius platythorax TaxID=488582 RepID=A0AAV2N6R5_9HYME
MIQRGSVYLSFGLLERSSAHLTGGRLVVFAISLCALLHFPFLLNDSRNLVEHGEPDGDAQKTTWMRTRKQWWHEHGVI